MATGEWPATEEWRAIGGYDGWYEVSDHGRVRTWKEKGARPIRRAPEPRLMTVWPKDKGHLNIVFSHNRKSRARTVHQLVAEAFIGPRPEGLVTCHNDGDPTNNHVSNLRYDTHKGNEADKLKHGTMTHGNSNGQAKLTEEGVRAIRARRAEGESVDDLAAEFGIHRVHVFAVARRAAWKHVA